MTDAESPAAAIESEVPRVRALLRQQRWSEALEASQALLAEVPEQREALLFSSIAQRFLGKVPAALETLARLERHHPAFSRLYEERGNCFVFLKQAAPAIEAFRRAVSLNEALPSSWRSLATLHRMTGDKEAAAAASRQVDTLQSLPREVVTAMGLFADGDLVPAESMVRAYLLQHGNHVEAMRLLAGIGSARKIYDDAELLLAAVLKIAPDYRPAREDYAAVLIEVHKHREARRQLELLIGKHPENRRFKMLYAATAAGLGEHERAVDLYRALLQGGPEDADIHLSIAHAQKTLGRREQSIESYRQAAACRPGFGDAYWSLANLKTYRFSDAELVRLRAAESAAANDVDRYHLCFALGKALEDRGEFAEAFGWYSRGNALKRAESNYRPEIIENNTRQQIAVCTRDFFRARSGWGADSPGPIFIVGLPRSGSTLIEQILASHSQVEGTQELANIQQIVQGLLGRDPDLNHPRYPKILAEMSADDFRVRGEQYLEETRSYRAGKPASPGGAPQVVPLQAVPLQAVPFFIDKMPNNFRHLGLIHLMLPNARIIDARREPMACCFSNLKQLFARGQEFTYSIEDIARYYRTYLELMRHWDSVLPGRILRIQHEDVVEDLEGNVRRLLAFCGLEFEPACVEFHKTARSVRTASAEQVRQPLNRDGLDQWKHFEHWLSPLRDALGDALQTYRNA
jgi:tetratricopeptide (TPR) repeat protein